jgi:GxxExxY protein
MKHKDLTDKIIQAFYKVYNNLRYGFLEKVYENAMMIELKKGNLSVISQSPIRVYYDEKLIGEYYADLLIDDKVIVEIKAAKSLALEHEAQLLNYLKATNVEVGLLLNFGPQPEIRRKVFDNNKKQIVHR